MTKEVKYCSMQEFETLLSSIKTATSLTEEEISKRMDYNEGYISQTRSRGKVPEKLFNNLLREFRNELHADYNSESNPKPTDQPANYTEQRRNHKLNHIKEDDITVYQIGTKASFIDIYDDEKDEPIGKLNSSVFPGCNHAEKVSGSSMYPMIFNQAMVVGEVAAKILGHTDMRSTRTYYKISNARIDLELKKLMR